MAGDESGGEMRSVLGVMLFFCVVLPVILWWKKEKKLLHPGVVFGLVWFVTLSLYQFRFSILQQKLSGKTLLIFIICVLLFNVGVFVAYEIIPLLIKRNEKREGIEAKKRIEWSRTGLKIAKWVIVIGFMVEMIYSGGFPLLWKFTGSSKTYFDFGIPSVNGALCGLLVLVGAYSLSKRSKFAIVCLAIGVCIISRQVIISMIIEGMVLTILDKKNWRFSWRRGVIYAVIGVTVFGVVGNFRSGQNTMDEVFRPNEGLAQKMPSSVKWVYSYMTFSISNFNNLVSKTDGGKDLGANIIDSFIPNIFSKKIYVEKNEKIDYFVSPNYNVSTYLPGIYLDFGVVGVGIFNLLIGAVGGCLCFLIQKSRRQVWKIYYAIFLHNIILLFFNNMFLYLPIMVQIVYATVLFWNEWRVEWVVKNSSKKDSIAVQVLMSTYNGEKYLKQQIESILAQDGVEVDLLVRDDGSTDKTCEILDEYKKAGKLDWYSGKNLGSARSFMDLLKHAKDYKYYAFADQDDFWLPGKLKRAVDILEEKANSKKPLVYFGNKEIVNEKLEKIRENDPIEHVISFQSSMMRCIATGCTMVMNDYLRNILNEYEPKYISMHDAWSYRVCMAVGGEAFYDDIAYIKYRQHENNVIGYNNDFTNRVRRRVKSFLKPDGSRSKTAKELLKGYSSLISPEYKKELCWLAEYKKSFLTKLKLLSNEAFKADGLEDDLVFKIAVLFGKV